MRDPLDLHTPLEAEGYSIERLRAMTGAEKLAVVTELCQKAHDLAWAALQERYPSASERELFLRMAVLRLGEELARKAYPEVANLPQDPSAPR